jgi:hypothetical protein
MFINRQFKITPIEHDYEQFVNLLLKKMHEKGLSVSLMDIFVTNTLATMERIRAKAIDINKLELLLDVENEMKEIEKKFF